jgi:hypothetical protein
MDVPVGVARPRLIMTDRKHLMSGVGEQGDNKPSMAEPMTP